MIYTDENIVMNGIYLDVPLLSANNEGVQNNTSFFFFNGESEMGRVLTKLIEMENDILQYYQFITPVNNKKKTPVFFLKSQIEKGYIKWGFTKSSFPKTIKHICLKISGVWENNQEYGINYKFLPY